MKFSKVTGLLLAASSALIAEAKEVKFKVIAVNGTPLLNINNQQYPMTLDEYPIYKVKVDVDNFPVKYNYMITYDNKEYLTEEFERVREDEKALNDFFDRSITVKQHPQLPRAFEKFQFAETSKLYDDTFVGTIIINCDQNSLDYLYAHPSDETMTINGVEQKAQIEKVQVIYATPYTVKKFNNATLSISGQSTTTFSKLSYKLKNLKSDKKKELFKRSTIKLRSEQMDPSFLRDKIYGDVLNSLGVPTAQNKFVRVFINGEAVGLFDLSDDVTSDRYLRETYNSGAKYNSENPIFKVDYYLNGPNGPAYGDLGYYGNDLSNAMYSIYIYKGKESKGDEFSRYLLPLLQKIDSFAKGSSNEEPIDSESFLKSMAMEYLGGGIDNYWNKPGNYYLYNDLEKNRWYFHDADFHFTFGIGGEAEQFLTCPLSQYPVNAEVEKGRAPLDGFRSRPEYETRFIQIFDRLLKTGYHPNAIFERIDSLAALIREDAHWDLTLPRVSKLEGAQTFPFTSEDFEVNTSSMEPKLDSDITNLKYFIQQKINSISKELGIKIPEKPIDDLGYVENPDSSKTSFGIRSMKIDFVTLTIFSSLVLIFTTLF